MKNELSYIDSYNDSNGIKAGITSAVFAAVGIALMIAPFFGSYLSAAFETLDLWFFAPLFLIFGAVIGKMGSIFTGELDGKMLSRRFCKWMTVLSISLIVIHVLVTALCIVILVLNGGR